MSVVVGFGDHFTDWHYATIHYFASVALKLDRRVMDVESLPSQSFDLEQDAVALRGRNVFYLDVACQRVGLRTEAPDMKVVHVDDAFDSFHSGANLIQRQATRCAFEENVQRFADDIEGTPQYQRGDDDGQDWVDPVLTGEQNGAATGNDGCGRKRIACHVDKGAAHIDVAGYTPKQCGNYTVHQHAGRGYPHHQAGLNHNRSTEAMHRFYAYPEGNQDQRGGVQKRCQDAGPLISEGLLVGGRARLKIHGDE